MLMVSELLQYGNFSLEVLFPGVLDVYLLNCHFLATFSLLCFENFGVLALTKASGVHFVHGLEGTFAIRLAAYAAHFGTRSKKLNL